MSGPRFGKLSHWMILLCSQTMPGQGPAIGRNGIYNAASRTPLALVRNEIARESLVTVTGVRLVSQGGAGGVRISGAWGAAELKIVAASPTRMEVRIPAGVPLGSASLTIFSGGTISSGGRSGPAIPIQIVGSQFGIFSRNGKGFGPGQIDNSSASGKRTPNSLSQSATPGQVFVVSGTGLGNATAPRVMIGDKPAAAVSLRHATARNGADEITARIPADAPEGCFVPVQVRHAGRVPSNIVTMAIHRGRGPCSLKEAIPFAGWAGSRFGFLAVARGVSQEADSDTASITDEAGASFGRMPQVDQMPLLFLAPPPGLCVSQVEAVSDSLPEGNPFVALLMSGGGEGALSTGESLAINDGRMQQRIRPVQGAAGVYHSKFRAPGPYGEPGAFLQYLSPARLNISAQGGSVGRFGVTVTGPEPFILTGSQLVLDRARGGSVHWGPLAADRMALVVLFFADPATFTTGSCYCVAAPGATEMKIPPDVLANFPALRPAYGGAQSWLTVVSWPGHPISFQAPGLEHGLAISTFLQTLQVTLR